MSFFRVRKQGAVENRGRSNIPGFLSASYSFSSGTPTKQWPVARGRNARAQVCPCKHSIHTIHTFVLYAPLSGFEATARLHCSISGRARPGRAGLSPQTLAAIGASWHPKDGACPWRECSWWRPAEAPRPATRKSTFTWDPTVGSPQGPMWGE